MRYNWIEIKEVAAKYNVTEERLTEWAEQGKLISITKRKTLWFREDNIKDLLDMIILTEAARQELAAYLERTDETLFIVKSLEKINPLYRYIIDLLSGLITNPEKKRIFLHISTGKPIAELTKKQTITYGHACRIYENCIDELRWKYHYLQEKVKDIDSLIINHKKYQSDRAQFLHELTSLKEFIASLLVKKSRSSHPKKKETQPIIPETVIRTFSRKITDLNINIRTINIFIASDILTIGELLHYMQNNPKRLLKLKGMGKLSYNDITSSLQEIGVLDQNLDSPLFKYL